MDLQTNILRIEEGDVLAVMIPGETTEEHAEWMRIKISEMLRAAGKSASVLILDGCKGVALLREKVAGKPDMSQPPAPMHDPRGVTESVILRWLLRNGIAFRTNKDGFPLMSKDLVKPLRHHEVEAAIDAARVTIQINRTATDGTCDTGAGKPPPSDW